MDRHIDSLSLSGKKALLTRLAQFYFSLRDCLPCFECVWVSSVQLAQQLGVDDTQIRKDLALIGLKGRPRMGFKRDEVVQRLREILGLDKQHQAIVIGAGRLGGAIAEYPGFRDHGLSIEAFFDIDPAKVGTQASGCRVYHVDEMVDFIRSRNIRLAVLTCPVNVARGIASDIVRAGVKTIWNFTSSYLAVPADVVVRNEHISVGLAELTYYLK